jgi:hypothetical protein
MYANSAHWKLAALFDAKQNKLRVPLNDEPDLFIHSSCPWSKRRATLIGPSWIA